MLAAVFALLQLVESNSQQPRDQFQLCIGPAILARARICRDVLRRACRQAAIRFDVEAQSRREAFERLFTRPGRGIRLAVDDQREDAMAAAHTLVATNFFVDPTRSGCRGRTDDDEMPGSFERLPHRAGEVSRARQLIAIAKHRSEPGRHRTVPACVTDQALGNAVGLDRIVKPTAPALVDVAVADKREVPKVGAHLSSDRLIDRMRERRDEPAPPVRQYTRTQSWLFGIATIRSEA